METPTEKDIEARLLDFLSNLPNTDTVNSRQALVIYTELQRLNNKIDWQGNSLNFFTGLLNLLACEGQVSLHKFLVKLAQSPWVGPDRQENLATLSNAIASFTPERWNKAFTSGDLDIQETIKRFRTTTVQEQRIVGSKYIPDLYFPRLRTEASFKRFLESDTTCFLVVAKAGRGKTNLMCRIVEELQDQRPILFLSGRVEPKDSDGILKHIAGRLGYGENWSACFEDLINLADSGLAPLILIDGINESAANPQIMQAALRELLFQAISHKVKVCVTCRTDFWKFYRAPFWGEYSWRDTASPYSGKVVRGEDLPIFPQEDFDFIIRRYFDHFHIQGELVNEAWERCRNPLLLRFFCEAYHNQSVGMVSQIRLYGLFRLFWERKIENIQDLAGLLEPHPIYKLVLTVAFLMYQRHQTKVPKEAIAKEIGYDLTKPDSLYLRVLDEEIILEEELDELLGTTNVIFVYDKFTEYAIALSIFSNRRWLNEPASDIVADVLFLLEEEARQRFTALRGALEFMVLRMEDRRQAEGIHYSIINVMLDRDWKWRRIGTMLAFQLTGTEETSYWKFLISLTHDKRDFVRRICAEQLGQLANHHADRTLPLLNQYLQDDSPSVRQTARASLLSLDASSAIQEALLLIGEQPFGFSSVSLATEILLWPMDSLSPLLQEKARWLVKENRDSTIQKAICEHFVNLNLPAYKDLYILEELESTFQVDWKDNYEPDNPYLQEVRHHLASREAVLNVDVKRLDTLRLIVHQLMEYTMQFLNRQLTEQEVILSAELQILIPSFQKRRAFLSDLEQKFKIPLIHLLSNQQSQELSRNANKLVVNRSLRLIDLAFEVVLATHAFAVEEQASYLVKLFPYNYHSLIRLCQIAEDVVQEAINIAKKPTSTITLDTELGTRGLNLQPEECVDFRNSFASKIGVELSVTEHRALFTLGRLSFWIWQAESDKYKQEQALEKRIEQVSGRTVDELRQRLSNFEATVLSQESQLELSLELQALCKLYADTQPIKVVEALTPLIVWLNENDSQVLSHAFQTLYLHDRDSFWVISEALLEHEDQRVVDFADQGLEQAEYAEEESIPSVIFDRLRGITVNQFGVDPLEVVPSGYFAEDPSVDSLDFIDLITPDEEEFEIQMIDMDKDADIHKAVSHLDEHLP